MRKANLFFGMIIILAPGSLLAFQEQPAGGKKFDVRIKDQDTKIVAIEGGSSGIDLNPRVKFQDRPGFQGPMNFFLNITTMRDETLHLSHMPGFMIDNRYYPNAGGGQAKPLGKTPSGKVRNGYTATWNVDASLSITQTVELVACKPKKPGEKKFMGAVLILHTVENKGNMPRSFGMKTYMDTFVIDNDGCLFAAPTIPNKILDGMVLEGKTLPPYLQMLQRPDLANPGYVSHFTLDLGGRYEKANKLVLSSYRVGRGAWDLPVVPAGGDSAISAYWPVKEIKPGGKREMAYAYGEGVAVPQDSEGRFQLNFGGSFEPGKVFTVTAVVADPAIGQSLSLDLPAGMQRLEGKEIQPVTATPDGQEFSTVVWKARVLEPGEHTLRIRSSTGITQTKIVSVMPR